MKEGWKFACYVTLADGAETFVRSGMIANLGQNKSAFAVMFQEQEDLLVKRVSKHLREGVVCCLGDCFVASAVYGHCAFAAVQLREYRAYETVLREHGKAWRGSVKKGKNLYKPVCAGSVFMPNSEGFLGCFKKPNCEKIGFNILTSKEEASDQ